MKKLVLAVATVLAMGSSFNAFAQEPEKTNQPAPADSTKQETPAEPASFALAQEPEKTEQPAPTDSTKQEKTECPNEAA